MIDVGVHHGRPFGGLGLLYNKNIVKHVCDLGVSINSRVMACSLEMNDVKYLIFNVYFPCWQAEMYDADVGIFYGFMQNVMNVARLNGQHVL
jgi:hypothetical protein